MWQSRHIQMCYGGDTPSRSLYQKLYQKPVWQILRKFITVSCTKTTLRPITLHGSCHMPDSFCAGIELCSIACEKPLPEKKLAPDWPTHVQDSCTRRKLVLKFLERVLPAWVIYENSSLNKKWQSSYFVSSTPDVGGQRQTTTQTTRFLNLKTDDKQSLNIKTFDIYALTIKYTVDLLQ